MAIPDKPYTRSEMYLDSIARSLSGGGGGGSGGGVLVVTLSVDASTMTINMDKTWQQIYDADVVTFRYEVEEGDLHIGSISGIVYDDNPSDPWYEVTPYFPTFTQANIDFNCTSRDAFPTAEAQN